MRIMLGVLAADSGEVRWDGAPLDLEVRRRVGYMPEERGLYPKMKVGEQLLFLAELHGMTPGRRGRRGRPAGPTGSGSGLGRGDNVEKLSLGNQQRVQLAAALVHDPEILVLDEPFSGLDPVAVDVMSTVLRERADAGVPVIFSSHQLDLVERLCDRVGIIRAGQMEALGTIDELRHTDRPLWLLDVQRRRRRPSARWSTGVPGGSGDARPGRGGAVVVELEPGRPGAEQDLLAGALALGDRCVSSPGCGRRWPTSSAAWCPRARTPADADADASPAKDPDRQPRGRREVAA